MQAIDIITSEVISVDENTTVPAIARLLAERGISAVPVVDKNNQVIGMVSEGDLLHRAETGTERRRSWWLDMIASTDKLAGDYIKSHSGKVKDVMTRNVLSVTETTPVADIALLLEANRIKRVPVVRDGKLVGIVSRANLVQALAMTIDQSPSGAEAEDRTIREKLLAELKAQKWAEVSPANVIVKDGVVHLWSSSYLSEQEKRALVVAAENIPGVRWVEDHMRRVGTTLLGYPGELSRELKTCRCTRSATKLRFQSIFPTRPISAALPGIRSSMPMLMTTASPSGWCDLGRIGARW